MVLRTIAQSATPSRKEVLALVAAKLGCEQNRVVIKQIKQEYGERVIEVYANVYDSADDVKRIEYPHYLKRLEGKKGAEQQPAQQAPQEAK